MHELEEFVSQLSKVWQVVEEPDFPWLGYRADAYNLEVRSEVLTALENINEALSDLQLETEDFSAKLGVFPPETFARIVWLIEVSKFLYESPKPEAKWLTNPDIEKLYNEAKNYNEITIWIKDTRVSLNERYNPSFSICLLTGQRKLSRHLDSLGKTVSRSRFGRKRISPKRENFSAFVKNTQVAARKWRETSWALAPMLGLDGEGLTIQHLKDLSRMALLFLLEDKPEPQWFDAKYLEQVQETLGKQNDFIKNITC